MARHILGGSREDGRSSYQIALSVCAACGAGQQHAGGELVPVSTDIVAMAHCDGQHLGRIPLAANENALPAHVGARTEGHEKEGAKTEGAEPTPGARVPPPEQAPVGARATQTIPPALRRAVLVRDQHCCRVPGCRNSAFLDLHHIEPRSEGGRNILANILTICGAHHRAVHRGSLLIEKDSTGGVRFRHGDGTAYGQVLGPQLLDVQAKLFSALRRLGFREGEVRAVLRELRQDESLRDAGIEDLLSEALRRIGSR